eukprot:gene7409-1324_t
MVTVTETDSMKDVLALMSKKEVLSVPIQGEDRHHGMFDVWDTLKAVLYYQEMKIPTKQYALAHTVSLRVLKLKVADIQVPTLDYLPVSATLWDAMLYFVQFQYHRLAFRSDDEDGRCTQLEGMISRSGVFRYLAAHKEVLGELGDMSISELSMGRVSGGVPFLRESDTLGWAFKQLNDQHSAIPVVEEKTGKLATFVSVKDLVGATDFSRLNSSMGHVKGLYDDEGSMLDTSHQSATPETCCATTSLNQVIDKFVSTKAHTLFVLKPDGKLDKIISKGAVMRAIVGADMAGLYKPGMNVHTS